MRSAFIWTLLAIFGTALTGQALGQDSKTILEGAQRFCTEKYGDRLLGVTLNGENGFNCRFAAVEQVKAYKLTSPPPQPIWDLDGEDEDVTNSESASGVPNAVPVPAKSVRKARLHKRKSYRKRKRKYRKRKYRKRRYSARKASRRKRDPFVWFGRRWDGAKAKQNARNRIARRNKRKRRRAR